MENKNSESFKSFLVLFFSFTFANSVTVALHELGHALLIASKGYGVRVILHPYLSSRVIWNPAPELLGIVDAAGPLFNIIISILIIAILWKFRRPSLMPLVLMAPIAYFQEGFSSFMQIILKQPGTDSIRIIQAGFPTPVLLIISITFLIAGILLFVALLPVFGIKREYSFGRVFSIVYGATGLNMVIMLLFGLTKNRDEMIRAIILLAGMLLFSLIFASLFKAYFSHHKIYGINIKRIKTGDIVITLVFALTAVISGIVFYG